MSASKYAGLAEGAADMGQNFHRQREAQSRSELSHQKLKAYQAQAPVRQTEQEVKLQQLENQLFTSQQQGLKDKTYSAFRNYSGDGNIKHLNNFLNDAKSNAAGQGIYGDVVRYDSLERTEDTASMLKKLGVKDVDGFFSDPELANSFVLATKNDGEKQIVDMDKAHAATGYTQYMSDAELERMSKRSQIFKNMQTGQSHKSITANERVAREWADVDPDVTFHEAYQILIKGKGGAGGTTQTERLASKFRDDDPSLGHLESIDKAVLALNAGTAAEREANRRAATDGTTQQSEYEDIKKRDQRTTKQRSTEEINASKAALDKAFGGDFLSFEAPDPTANPREYNKYRRQASKLISRIEQDFPMSTTDRKKFGEIRALTHLSSVAGEKITDAEAGPIDSMVRGVKKYFSNDVKGIDGTAAYEAYRNTLRHALYGATLSSGEIGAFNAAMGSLSEQKGPVLIKLKTSIEELQSQLQSIYDMNDEYVAKHRLNMGADELANVISALEERLEMIDEAGESTGGGEVISSEGEPAKAVADYFKKDA